jgi:hypothetical protein
MTLSSFQEKTIRVLAREHTAKLISRPVWDAAQGPKL